MCFSNDSFACSWCVLSAVSLLFDKYYLILRPAEVADVELWLLRAGQHLSHDLPVLRRLSAGGELAEVDVEAVHRVHASAAGSAFELGEGGAVLAVLQRALPTVELAGYLNTEDALPGNVLAAAVLADGSPLHFVLNIFHQLLLRKHLQRIRQNIMQAIPDTPADSGDSLYISVRV